MGRCSVRVISLQGRVNLNYNCDNPFTAADRILKEAERATFTLVDFHAEATSEKLAMGYYLDGRISALWAPIRMFRRRMSRFCPGVPGISPMRA